ncbi:MAG TPA: serine/threonine-protein kinase [Candidatus Acidoferrum sp.]|nr:serine/threonine-protein kinase [Candidatus Acidoferrum sp.]
MSSANRSTPPRATPPAGSVPAARPVVGPATIRALPPPPLAAQGTPPAGSNLDSDTIMGYIAPLAPGPVHHPIPEDLLAPGTQVGDYEIIELIGAGGMGSVYAARYPAIERRVAIKVIASHLCRDARVVQQFVIEARAANQIDNRHVVDIHTLGTLPDGRPYLVMELLRGQTLSQRLRYGPLPVGDAVEILEQIAEAVEAAHAVPIVHRDLKPDNVFLEEGSDGPEVKILDFGIAKLAGDAAGKDQDRDTGAPAPGSPLRTTGVLIGTPHYMAPEQARAQLVGTPADLYALGLIAFEILAGRPPFEADNAAEIMVAHLQTIPPSLKALRPDVPEGLDELVERLLAKDPADRPTATQTREALRALYSYGSYPRMVPPVDLPLREHVRLWLQRPKNRVLFAAQIVIALAMLAAYLFIGDRDDEPRSAASARPAPAAAARSAAAPGPAAAPAAEAPAAPGQPTPVVEPLPAPDQEPKPAGPEERDAPIRDPF